jgi:para-aminobenzoate synthetase component 1
LEIFQAIYKNSRACFFLDTPQYAPPDQVYSYIGMDPALEIQLEGDVLHIRGEINGEYPARELFSVLRELLKREEGQAPFSGGLTPFPKEKVPVPFIEGKQSQSPPFFTGGFVGYFGYEAADLCDKIKFRTKPTSDVPRVYFGLFRDVIVYDHQKCVYYLVTNSRMADGGWRMAQKMEPFFEEPVHQKQTFRLKKFTAEMTKTRFKAMVEKAREYIAAGDIYQANLSQRFSFAYEGPGIELYEKLRAINPSPFSCFLKTGDIEVVSSSPERLIRKKRRVCETRPIAGTCPARGPEKRFAEWRRKLLKNEKEKAEHLMLVDLERNDLGRVCNYRSVKVEEFMTLERYSHVVHIVSRVTGDLKKGKDAFDVVKAMFPGGTITGCPKIRCMQIIDELEPVRRGIYTGSLGYVDLYGDMDLNIVIRTIILRKGKGQLQVGAGIVYDSNPEKEYEETLHKAEALISALVSASAGHNAQSATLNAKNKIFFSHCALPVVR